MEQSERFKRKIAELTKQRDQVAGMARDEARGEIARMLRALHRRFPRHKFHMDSGMGSVAVWCDKQIFGHDDCTPYMDQRLHHYAYERSEAFQYLEKSIRAMIELAETVESDFDTCVDTVLADE